MSIGIADVEMQYEKMLRLCDDDPWQDMEFTERFDASWIYHDNALEGVVLLFNEMISALRGEEGQNTRLLALYQGIRNHQNAISFIRDEYGTRKARFTVNTIKEIHSILVDGIPGCAGGRYRKDIPLHRTYYHDIVMPEKISYYMRKLDEFVAGQQFKAMHPLKQASKVHFRLLTIFPFSEFSGKVARLSMNFLLANAGFMPVVIHSVERQRYYESLRSPHGGSRTLLLESMSNCIANAVKHYRFNHRKAAAI